MNELFEDLMRSNDPARDAQSDPARREAVLALADQPVELNHRRSRGLRRLAVAASLVVVTGAVVGAQLTAPAPVAAALTASDVLTKAAAQASDPEASGDQYWKVTSQSQNLMTSVGEDSKPSTCLLAMSRTTYLAVDGSRPSWFVDSPSKKVEQIEGSDCTPGGGETWTTNQPPNASTGDWLNPTAEWVAKLPTDITELRAKLYADTKGQGNDPDDEAFVIITDLLRTGQAPASLRADLFEVLKTVDGTTITDSQVKVNDRSGVAIGRSTVDGSKAELIIDAATGELLGERTNLEVGGKQIETIAEYTPRSVVDAIPGSVKKAANHYRCTPQGECQAEPEKR